MGVGCRLSRQLYTRRVRPSLQNGALFGAVALGVFAFWPGANAWAHNQIDRTTPAADEVWTTSPVEVEIVTVENVLNLGGSQAGFAVVITDQSGLFYGDGCVEISEKSIRTLASLGEAGVYDVTYQLVSEDGHTISDRFSFSFAPNADHLPAEGYTTAPVCGQPPASDLDQAPLNDSSVQEPMPISAQPEPAETEEQSAQPGVGTMIAGAIGVAAVAGVIGWLLWRNHRVTH